MSDLADLQGTELESTCIGSPRIGVNLEYKIFQIDLFYNMLSLVVHLDLSIDFRDV